MQKLRLASSLELHYYPKNDISEYIRQGLVFHKKVGFDAADFPMWIIDFFDDNWKKHIENALKATDETGIKFELCHLPFSTQIIKNPELLPEFNQKVHCAIDAAAMLGVDYAVVHSNVITLPVSEFDRAEQYETVVQHLGPFVEHADKVGVKIVVENMRLVPGSVPVHRYCQEPDELCDVADALGIGVCWDFGHANICGVKQSEALSYIGSRLKVLHINDNNGIGDDHVAPFFGTIDWQDAMKGLIDIGFDGLFNYEVVVSAVPEVLREPFARYLIQCAGEMMKY